MTLKDNITFGRAKGLWTGLLASRWRADPLEHSLAYGTTGYKAGDYLPSEMEALTTYKHTMGERMRALRLNRPLPVKVVAEFQFEAVLGKTQRTEF